MSRVDLIIAGQVGRTSTVGAAARAAAEVRQLRIADTQ
jgi:hypothetical protein